MEFFGEVAKIKVELRITGFFNFNLIEFKAIQFMVRKVVAILLNIFFI